MAALSTSSKQQGPGVLPGPAVEVSVPNPAVQMDIKALLQSHVIELPLESAFHGCIKRVLVPDGRGPINLLETLKSFFVSTTPESIPLYLDQYVSFLSTQSNYQRISMLLGILHSLVTQGYIQPRLVCEVLLKYLTINNEIVWSESLDLVRKLVGGVHYKGCRDLMKLLFTKFDCLPRTIPEHQIPVILKGQELLRYILNRNSTLLPAYFAHDEICRHYPDKNSSAHWILQEVIKQLQDEMRAAADLVSGIVQPFLRPVLGVSNLSVSIWHLDLARHSCALKGLLPYRETLLVPQEELLFHVVAQQNSKDAVHSILDIKRQHLQPSSLVEEALVRLGMMAMEVQEKSVSTQTFSTFEVWSHFASQLVYFHFLQLINITSLLTKLRSKLSRSKLRKGRDWLMWSLLHFSSTAQNKASQLVQVFQKEFVPIINLFSLLYQDKEPLSVPDYSSPTSVYQSAAASIWMVYANKGKAENVDLPRPLPHVLDHQIEWLTKQSETLPPSNLPNDFSIPILLNIYSNNNEMSSKLLKIMLEAMLPPQKTPPTSSSSPPSELASSKDVNLATPISLPTLNSLAMHAKIRLMEMIKTHLIKVVEAKSSEGLQITPALLETYSRLLVWLGTRNFQSHLIPAVFKSQAWGVLHALLEIIVFRVHLQLQYSYRFQLLQQLHTVASVSIIPAQLYGSTENAALRLIRGLNSPEFLIQLAKQFATDPKPLLSTDSEELNRIFVLVVAQSLHISNIDTTNWLEPFMRAVFTTSPNLWCENTLSFFPPLLRQICGSQPPAEQLISKVEEEMKRFQGLSSEMEQTRLFTETESASLFLCVLWKIVVETGSVSSVLIKIAQRTQPKKLAAFMRKFVDYVIMSLPPATPSMDHLDTTVKWLNELVWRYNLFPLNRLIMCMILRGYDTDQTAKCLTVIQAVLNKSTQLITRLKYLVEEVPADYWNQPMWYAKHAAYLEKFPESFQPEEPSTSPGQPQQQQQQLPTKSNTSMPMYFGNVCLRFLPVFDLLLHRLLEMPSLADLYLEQLLSQFGPLYKFHDQPVSFLYSTLHYYWRSVMDHTHWKKSIVSAVIGAQHSLRPISWYFTSEFSEYLNQQNSDSGWCLAPPYYSSVITRLVKGLRPFSSSSPCDWHFSEFSTSLTFALYTCCVELMALPLSSTTISKQILHTLYQKASGCGPDEDYVIFSWINALGLVFVSLPELFRVVLYEEIIQILGELDTADSALYLSSMHRIVGEGSRVGCLISLLHSYFMHANMGLLLHLPQWLSVTVRPVVRTEWQLLFVCHLLGPILNRLTSEKPKLLIEVVMEIYHLVVAVDKLQQGHFTCSDVLCDFLYHIKYMHVGDHGAIEQLITNLHHPLKLRLQFLCPSLQDKHASASTASLQVPTPPLLPTQQTY